MKFIQARGQQLVPFLFKLQVNKGLYKFPALSRFVRDKTLVSGLLFRDTIIFCIFSKTNYTETRKKSLLDTDLL